MQGTLFVLIQCMEKMKKRSLQTQKNTELNSMAIQRTHGMRKYQRRRGNTFESELSQPNQTLFRKRHAMRHIRTGRKGFRGSPF
jgi:hypothetical protein